MKFLRRADFVSMPWKNGGGVTEEIERVPREDHYAWRLSRAHVAADGPFSLFPGYDRWLVVLEGAGLTLNKKKQLLPLEPFLFAGEDVIECGLLQGPVWDLGLIFDRDRVKADMKVVNGPQPLPLQGDVHHLFAVHSDCEMDGHRLPALDCVKKEGSALFRLNKGCLVVVTMTFLDPSLREA